MGDRCYMKLDCKKEHAPVFEKLGFVRQGVAAPDVVEMVDEEANYAHDGKMPESVPYRGWHSVGGDYGACAFACDGKKLFFTDTDNNGEPVVRLDDGGKPIKADTAVFLRYRACEKRAKKLLGLDAKS